MREGKVDATRRPPSSLISAMITVAPSLAKCVAMPSPYPDPPPDLIQL